MGGRAGQVCSVLATLKESESPTVTGSEPRSRSSCLYRPWICPPPHISAFQPPLPLWHLSPPITNTAHQLEAQWCRTASPRTVRLLRGPQAPTHSPSRPPDAPPAAPVRSHHPSLPKTSSRKPGSPQPARSSPTTRVRTTWTSQAAAPGLAPARASTPGARQSPFPTGGESSEPGSGARAAAHLTASSSKDPPRAPPRARRPPGAQPRRDARLASRAPAPPVRRGEPQLGSRPPHSPGAAVAAALSPRRVTRPGRTISPPRRGARGLAERASAPRSERDLVHPHTPEDRASPATPHSGGEPEAAARHLPRPPSDFRASPH